RRDRRSRPELPLRGRTGTTRRRSEGTKRAVLHPRTLAQRQPPQRPLLARRLEQLEMAGARPEDPPLTIRRLLLETAREPKDISPHLAGGVTRAVLEGTPYPRAFFDTVLRRVRIEADINRVKAACLKSYLIRNGATTMDSSLNKRHPEPAYHCGRMLSLLAIAQDEAIKSVNAGVVRRNMGAAMATPGLVLGRLLRAAE